MIIKIHVSFFVPPILFSNNKRSKFTFIILYIKNSKVSLNLYYFTITIIHVPSFVPPIFQKIKIYKDPSRFFDKSLGSIVFVCHTIASCQIDTLLRVAIDETNFIPCHQFIPTNGSLR